MSCIGTAGHVDHGKSTLVTALTGMDPDRLAEEKARGMTIDLGFAWLTLPSGREASIVDVPGHESFIKNMLAGVGGIDVALLVVAADEGVMPQTEEHLAILDLLQTRSGVVALTKVDLVDREWLDLVREEIAERLAATSLAGAPIVACSAVTGRGLSDLLAALDAALDASPARRDIGRPRLPIDRVFTITGFGTVVTGALQDGVLHTRQEVEVAPHGLRVRVRGLQTHKRVVEEGRPGGRLAINLAGVAKADIARGDVVTLPGLLRPTTALDVRLHALAGAPRAIPHGAMLDVYVGAFETTARVLLLDRDELPPGESGWAQLRLARPTVAARGDRFIARAPSPSMTVGGGMIVDPWARRHRRRDPAILARLETLERGAPDAITLLALAGDTTRAVSGGQDDSQLAHSTGLHASERAEALRLLGERGRATQVGARWYATSVWERLRARSLALLADYHREYPLRWGMPREAWRARLGLASAEVADVIAALAALGEAAEGAGSSGGNAGARQSGRSSATVRLPTHAPRFTPEQECRVSAVLARFAADPFAPPTRAEVEAEVGAEALAALVERETLVRLSDAILLERAAYDEVIRRVVAHLRAYDTLTVAQARDLLSTSRKYMLAIFESLDERRITQRRGDDRVLGPNAPIESPDA